MAAIVSSGPHRQCTTPGTTECRRVTWAMAARAGSLPWRHRHRSPPQFALRWLRQDRTRSGAAATSYGVTDDGVAGGVVDAEALDQPDVEQRNAIGGEAAPTASSGFRGERTLTAVGTPSSPFNALAISAATTTPHGESPAPAGPARRDAQGNQRELARPRCGGDIRPHPQATGGTAAHRPVPSPSCSASFS